MNCMKCMKLVPERISLQRFETTGGPAFVSFAPLHRSPKLYKKCSSKFRGTPKLSNHEFYARTENAPHRGPEEHYGPRTGESIKRQIEPGI